MPMDSGTPDLVRHCVAAVAKQYGGDTQKAFAICVAQLQKNGYLKPGTMELTAAGKKKEKEHEAEPDAKKKLAAYEKLLKADRVQEGSKQPNPKFRVGDEVEILDPDSGEVSDTAEVVSLKGFDAELGEWTYACKSVHKRHGVGRGVTYSEGDLRKAGTRAAESRSVHYDYEALLDRNRKSGFEETPRPVARKYETVTREESQMDLMRRLSGIAPRHIDRTAPVRAAPARSIERVEEAAPGDLLLKIAKKHFPGVETLDTRNSDSMDFHDVAVWAIKDALEAAYEAGLQAGKGKKK